MEDFNIPVCRNPLKTRKDFQEAVKQLCEPLKSFYSRGGARLHIGNTGSFCSESVARMEAFARPLWGLVPLAAGGGDTDFWRIYLEGIKNGTNPAHEEYWGDLGGTDQRMVEMAVLGIALALVPGRVWHPLRAEEQQNFARWMYQINEYVVVDNNWLFFRVLVNVGLKRVGAAYSSEMIKKDLNRLDEFYLSDGWYRDGMTEQRDYYIPFAMHYYSLIYAIIMGDEDEARAKIYRQRAARFAQDFVYWFAADGAAVPFGRSLTYRFAQSAFWSALAFAGVEALPWGVVKGLVCRNLRWWFRQPIFSTDGILTIGYGYPNLNMAEGYNAPGSPYWAMKTFLCLALPEDHPFWQAEEAEMPELADKSMQEHPHMLVCRNGDGRHAVAFTAGQYAGFEPVHCAAKYEKFAYSSLFGFSVSRGDFGLEQGAYDSMLALSEGDNLYRVRRRCEEFRVEENMVYSRWKPWRDVEVQTWLVPIMPWHVRIHRIKTLRGLETAEGGFAIAREKDGIIPSSDSFMSDSREMTARLPWGVSSIVNVLGDRMPEIVWAEPNTNLMAPRTVIPTLKGTLEPGTHLLICAVLGDVPASSCGNPPKVTLEKGVVRIQDGETGESILELEIQSDNI